MKKDTYSGTFFERELGPWTTQLSTTNVFIEFDFKVNVSEQGLLLNDPSTMDFAGASQRNMLLARNRATLGLVARSNSVTRFVEINLFKTPNFDLCTTSTNVEQTTISCESATGTPAGYDNTVGLFDRRSSYGAGQIVYYDFGQLGRVFGPAQTSISADGQWHHVRIPVTSLFRDAPWTDAASLSKTNGLVDLSGISFDALYIGHEVWGRGRIWTEYNNFKIYTFSAN